MGRSKKKGKQPEGDGQKKKEKVKRALMPRRSMSVTIKRRERRQAAHQNRVRRKLDKLRVRLDSLFQIVSYLGATEVDHENVAHLSRGTLHKRVQQKMRRKLGLVPRRKKKKKTTEEKPATVEDGPASDDITAEEAVDLVGVAGQDG